MGVAWALISGFSALFLALFVGFGCDDVCRSPGPGVPWRSTDDAWQWDALSAIAWLSVVLAVLILALACMPRVRPRASIAAGGVQLAAGIVALVII